MSTKEIVFDRRIIARNIKHGRTSRKEFEQHLANLPDATSKAVPIFSGSEVDDRGQPGDKPR